MSDQDPAPHNPASVDLPKAEPEPTRCRWCGKKEIIGAITRARTAIDTKMALSGACRSSMLHHGWQQSPQSVQRYSPFSRSIWPEQIGSRPKKRWRKLRLLRLRYIRKQLLFASNYSRVKSGMLNRSTKILVIFAASRICRIGPTIAFNLNLMQQNGYMKQLKPSPFTMPMA